MRTPVPFRLLIAFLSLSACDGSARGTFRGVYTYEFEVSAFRACGTSLLWWASGELQPMAQTPPDPGAPGMYAVVDGELSAPGSCGHLGTYPRQLEVRKVRHVEPKPPASCP